MQSYGSFDAMATGTGTLQQGSPMAVFNAIEPNDFMTIQEAGNLVFKAKGILQTLSNKVDRAEEREVFTPVIEGLDKMQSAVSDMYQRYSYPEAYERNKGEKERNAAALGNQ